MCDLVVRSVSVKANDRQFFDYGSMFDVYNRNDCFDKVLLFNIILRSYSMVHI